MLERLPDDRSLAAYPLVRDGSHCKWCLARHRCPRYRGVAPTWWKEVSTTGPVAPFDTWGTLLEVGASNGRGHEVTLRDAADRPVWISGLEARLGTGDLRGGDEVWFFELEPSERLPHHGAYTHPRNFHGVRPARGWSDALRLRVFRGPSRPGRPTGE